ncbi:hypothetical protein DL96DRAFT_1683349 [Flagelloscypha sp. PMI_526]|nr:hypothetical protein DL96DRAFT_1683349 [Flagelloscypha sp. PMI_526]
MVWIPLLNSTVATFPLGLPDQNVTGLVDIVGFQQAPNLRGTVGIIVSCVTVLVIALYNSYHPDGTNEQNWSMSIWVGLVTMLTPEFMVVGSAADYFTTKQVTAQFNGTLKLSRWTPVHSFVLRMGQFSITLPSGSSQKITSRNQLAEFVRNGALRNDDLPTAKQLKELSKTHILVKIFTIFQVSWMIVQCFARWLSHFPVTLLELMTSCYAICAVLIYVFWMDKPYRMDARPYVILCSGSENSAKNEQFLAENGDEDDETDNIKDDVLLVLIYVLTAFILSALHFSAWHNEFPTKIEQRLWRITSVFHVPVAGIATIAILFGASEKLPTWIALSVAVLPSLSRLLLLGLSIASLRALPAGAYVQLAWTNFIPHFS